MDRKVVTELIQSDFTASEAAAELKRILEGEGRRDMQNAYAALKIKVGGAGASGRAAALIVERTLQNK